jgi:hypothetical protein
VLAKYQRRLGHTVKILKHADSDPLGFFQFYNEPLLSVDTKEFLKFSINEGKNYDVIHVHSIFQIVPELRQEYGYNKKIILHYHGSDIRGATRRRSKDTSGLTSHSLTSMYRKVLDKTLQWRPYYEKSQRLANAVIVSTPDLLRLVTNGNYIPNAIDTEHFREQSFPNNHQIEALTIDSGVTNVQLALTYCKKHNLNLNIDIHDRTKNPIMFNDMPEFLRRYKIYVDIKFVDGEILQASSKTALEALACGLKVLDYRLQYQEGLPKEYDPLSVVSKILDLYN